MTTTQDLKTYSFTDEQIDFILDIITNNAQYEDDEDLGDWMKELSKHRYAVHLMRTRVAGTFAMNCSYFKIPCIGYKGLDTQTILHPLLSVDIGDIVSAKKLAQRLKKDEQFYVECSNMTGELFDKYYTKDAWLTNFWNNYDKLSN